MKAALILISFATVLPLRAMASVPAATPGRCERLFVSPVFSTRNMDFQVKIGGGESGSIVKSAAFDVVQYGADKKLRLRTVEGQILDEISINGLTKKYGEIQAVHRIEYESPATLYDEASIASRLSSSVVPSGVYHYMLTHVAYAVRAERGVIFYETYGQGQLARYAAVETEGPVKIHLRQVIVFPPPGPGVDRIDAIEVKDARGRAYYAPDYRAMITHPVKRSFNWTHARR